MALTDVTDEDFDIIAFNGVTGDCLTTDDVLPILYLPTSTPSFERGIWEAVLESPGRDWDETEREYLRRNDGIRESLADWARFMNCAHCWTGANLLFLSEWGNADEMDTPSADPNPSTQTESCRTLTHHDDI